jgi:membrane associated rhomboid family serine protease
MTEFRPGRFQILPTIIKNLIIINVLVFLAQQVLPQAGINLEDWFALHTFQSPLFKPWQFVTHLFMHGGWDHIFFNMFALWMFGSILENVWGPKRFLTFYLVSGLGAALLHMIVLFINTQGMIADYHSVNTASDAMSFLTKYPPERQLRTEDVATVLNTAFQDHLNESTLGASGAVFGCLAAFGYLFPNTYIYLYFFLPVKAKWFVLGYAALELYNAVQNSAGDNVAHFAHLGGALAGFLMVYFWNKTNRKTFY